MIAIYAGTNGYLDEVPVIDVKRFEGELIEFIHSRHPEVPRTILSSGAMSEDVLTTLKGAIEDFRRGFVPTGAGPAAAERNVGWERTAAPAKGSGEPTLGGTEEVLP